MVGITLFSHEDSIHAHVDISKDGVAKIVDAICVSGIVGIAVGQTGFQSGYPIAGSVRRTLTGKRSSLRS